MIVFQNPGLIDLRAIAIMGLNAKESKNPIGQFGTGLKYAISVLLRSGCQISIFRGEDEFRFRTEKSDFRGKSFDVVWMDGPEGGKELGYTLELGKHWEPWMAIRELESNARDEGGQSFATEDFQLSPTVTTIVISGPTAEVAYSQLPDIFISSKPLWVSKVIEVHASKNPEQLNWLYYRGVRAKRLQRPAAFRYNILSEIQLTEDRTFCYPWDQEMPLTSLGLCNKEHIIQQLISPPKNSLENDISYSEHDISEEFQQAVIALGARALPSAWKAVRTARGFAAFEEIPIDDLQQQMLERAWAFIERMGERRVRNFKVKVSPDLGTNRLGSAMRTQKEIWLSTRVFEMGMKQLISCLFEEFIHLDRNLQDLDYEMQNFLFDTIITQAAKLQGEIL